MCSYSADWGVSLFQFSVSYWMTGYVFVCLCSDCAHVHYTTLFLVVCMIGFVCLSTWGVSLFQFSVSYWMTGYVFVCLCSDCAHVHYTTLFLVVCMIGFVCLST